MFACIDCYAPRGKETPISTPRIYDFMLSTACSSVYIVIQEPLPFLWHAVFLCEIWSVHPVYLLVEGK